MKTITILFLMFWILGSVSLKAQTTCFDHVFEYIYDANGNRTARSYLVLSTCRILPEEVIDKDSLAKEITENPWEIGEDLKVKSYPNPTRSGFNIQLNRAIANSRIQIYGIKGDMIYNEPFSGRELYIDISAMPAGTYYIRIELPETESLTSKIIKL